MAERRYLTKMIEELPRDDDPNGLMVDRCIHLDTRAALGTRLPEARLQDRPRHQRLSRRVSPERTDGSLQDRELRDVTYRTQLYRIEDVLFLALFSFSGMFLSSRVLLGEWLADLGFVALSRERDAKASRLTCIH